ncbi:MAG: CotH kinase family protein, partial [Cryomorphaceae bacterium]|nr:CotH kinase family protein [Cryomorphaceae bacterium]
MNRLLLLFGLFLATSAWAQRFPSPPDNGLYRTDVVPRIDITIPADSLAAIFANVSSDYEYHADFGFTAPGLSLSGIEVGFRLRGNTSRTSAKKSFKISFNSFVSGARVQGVKELNLNGEHNDPSIMRARIAWELAQDAGMPAPRVNHVRLFINGQPYGLYANMEHYNDDYVEHRFARDAGNLYKCLWP